MEQNKWQLIKHETDKDFVYEITNGPISLFVNEDDMPGEDYGEDIPLLNKVVDALNKSGIPFHSENKLELDQHITIMEQSCEIDELQAKCDKYEAALKEIRGDGQRFIPAKHDILAIAREALSAGEGNKEVENAKEGIVRLLLSGAAEVSKDKESAEAYLESEGVDMTNLADNAKFITWLAELSKLLHDASDGQPVKINQEEARKWYNDGFTPYQCLRETWNME